MEKRVAALPADTSGQLLVPQIRRMPGCLPTASQQQLGSLLKSDSSTSEAGFERLSDSCGRHLVAGGVDGECQFMGGLVIKERRVKSSRCRADPRLFGGCGRFSFVGPKPTGPHQTPQHSCSSQTCNKPSFVINSHHTGVDMNIDF